MSSQPWPPLELTYVLNEVQEVTDWYSLGIQLGLKKHVLDTIENDFTRTQRRKTEMIDCWLKNGLDHTWEELKLAVKEVQTWHSAVKSREEEERRQKEEQENVKKGLSQIQKSLEDVKEVASRCADEKRDLGEKLSDKNSLWKVQQEAWKKEDELAMEREETTEGVKEAIEDGNFTSQFVVTFLRKKGYNEPENLSREDIHACLHEHVVTEEAKRAKQLLSRRIYIDNHQRAIKHLQKDSERWIKLCENYIKRIEDEIMAGFQNLLDPNKVAGFKHELEGLQQVLKDCKSASKECDMSRQETEVHLRECRDRLETLRICFSNSIQQLHDSSSCLSVHKREVELKL